MANLNRTICVTGGANTGVGECPLIPKNIIGMFIVPNNLELTPAQIATLQTTLQGLAANDVPANRIYPVHNFVGLTDNTGELVTETLGYGGIAPITEGKYDWTFRISRGGICLQKALRKFNNKSVRVLFYDASYVLYGTMKGANLMGIPLEMFYALPWTLSDGSGTTAGFNVRVVFDPIYFNDNLGYVETSEEGFLLSEIEGIKEINLVEIAPSAKPVMVIQALAGCGGENLFSLYSTELSEVALWDVTNATTGATIAITSVAANAGAEAFTVTIPATVDPVNVKLAPISELEAAGIEGYESKTIRIA